MEPTIAPRFTTLHPLSPYLTLVRDQDGTPRVLKRLSTPDDPAAMLRFRLEAWRASQLEGPRFARAYGDDTPDAGAPYYTMGYAQGPAATIVSPQELPEVLRQLAAALLELHRRGWVHGGLEPAHLRRTDGGLVVVGYGHLTPIGQRATHPGHPDFQAPEQAQGLPLDGRADLYAVGALLHYWLTNRAYAGTDALDGVDHPFVPLARRLLADRPADRLPDAAALLAQLDLPMDAPPPVWVPPLVRRPAATALIEGLLGELAGGVGAARRLEAPSGAGKTRFLDLADDTARRAGWPVARAKGLGPLEPPLAPWETLFAAVAEAVEDRQSGLSARFGARLTPPRAGSLPAGLGAEGARLRWLAAAAEFLAAAAPPGLVILLDDWHLADEGSQRALSYLRERLRHAPILWLVAGERLSISALALPPFSRDEGFALVAGLLSGTMAGPDVEKLVAAAAGNPWRLETEIALWRETGELRRERGNWVLAPALEPPYDAARLAYLRANALPTVAWTVGGMAAMLAPLARPAELVALLDEPEMLAEGLDALLRAGVLTEQPEGYRFTHAAYAALFLDAVSIERQDALRAQLLAAIPAEPSPADARRWVEHALLADRPDLTAQLALAAATDAIAAGGLAEARRLLEEGMVTLDTEHPDRGRYLAALAETFRSERQWDEARALWEEAARALPAGPERLAALLSLGAALDQLGQPAEARDRYREALGHAQAHGDPDTMTLALVGLTGALGALGEAEEATVSGEAALGAASEASALPRAAAMAALGAVLAVGPRDRQPEGVALLQRATALYEAEGDRLGLVAALGRLADADAARGELRLARETAERALALAEELEDGCALARAALTLSAAARELGDAPQAAQRAAEALTRARSLDDAALQADALAQEGLARQALGEPESAWSLSTEALVTLPGDASATAKARVWLARAETALAQGRLPEAAGAIAQAEPFVLAARRSELAGRRSWLLGLWAARSGDRERARQDLRSVLAQPNQHLVAEAALALGRLAAESGAQAEAAGWLEQARRGAVTLGLDRLARAAAEAEQGLAAGQAPAEGFEGAAWRLQAILAEAKQLVPKLVAPAEELSLLRTRAQEAEALAVLWKSLFLAEAPGEVAQAVTEAVFAATGAERVFVLGRSLEPLASRSREAGELPYSPALVRLDLCRSAMEHGWAVASEPAVDAVAQPIVAERPWGVIYVIGAGEAPVLAAIAEAAGLAWDRLES